MRRAALVSGSTAGFSHTHQNPWVGCAVGDTTEETEEHGNGLFSGSRFIKRLFSVISASSVVLDEPLLCESSRLCGFASETSPYSGFEPPAVSRIAMISRTRTADAEAQRFAKRREPDWPTVRDGNCERHAVHCA